MNFPDRYGNKSRNVKIEIKEIDRECKKREFCKAMKCDALEFLENPDKTEEEKQIIERLYCMKNTCPFTRWDYYEWLKENNFKIIKMKEK